tara:strand:- start:39 stop:596 length:558 start_codon:yes stop_codon:yes gene_type:complete
VGAVQVLIIIPMLLISLAKALRILITFRGMDVLGVQVVEQEDRKAPLHIITRMEVEYRLPRQVILGLMVMVMMEVVSLVVVMAQVAVEELVKQAKVLVTLADMVEMESKMIIVQVLMFGMLVEEELVLIIVVMLLVVVMAVGAMAMLAQLQRLVTTGMKELVEVEAEVVTVVASYPEVVTAVQES